MQPASKNAKNRETAVLWGGHGTRGGGLPGGLPSASEASAGGISDLTLHSCVMDVKAVHERALWG